MGEEGTGTSDGERWRQHMCALGQHFARRVIHTGKEAFFSRPQGIKKQLPSDSCKSTCCHRSERNLPPKGAGRDGDKGAPAEGKMPRLGDHPSIQGEQTGTYFKGPGVQST